MATIIPAELAIEVAIMDLRERPQTRVVKSVIKALEKQRGRLENGGS